MILHGVGQLQPSLAPLLQRWAQDGVEIIWHGDLPDADAAALNRLARSAEGDHLLFLHASVVPKVEALAAMLAALRPRAPTRSSAATEFGTRRWRKNRAGFRRAARTVDGPKCLRRAVLPDPKGPLPR